MYAPVAVFTPTPRIAGCASSRPPLPVPRLPRTCSAGSVGGTGSVRGVLFGEKPDTCVVPSGAVSVTVTTYAVPATRPQLSVLASVKQKRASVRHFLACSNGNVASCSTVPWSASANSDTVPCVQPVSGAS